MSEIDLNKLVGDTKQSKRHHFEQLAKMGIDVPELTERPQLPAQAAYIWAWYIELVNTTTISYTEIKSWSELMSVNIKPWEANALIRIEAKRNQNG